MVKITGAYPPAYAQGGTATVAHYLSKGLMELGHDVFVLTTDVNGGKRLAVTRGDTCFEGVPVRYCRWIRCPLPYHSFELVHELRKRIHRFDVALIASSWTAYGVLAGRECRRGGLPYVMYSHGSYGPGGLRRSTFKKWVWWRLFDRRLYNGAAALIALTRGEVEQIRAMGVDARVEVIPNGVDTASLSVWMGRPDLEAVLPELKDRPFLLFLGRVDRIKGLDLLIAAFERVHRRHPEHLLVVAGPSERGHGRRISKLVKELGLTGSVVFPGLVTGRTKTALLRAADLFVLSSYGEGLPMAALEAMACGVPVVLTRECNLPEVEEFGAGALTEATIPSVAEGLEAVLADERGRREMGARGRTLVERRFQWEDVCRRTAALCEEVLSNGG